MALRITRQAWARHVGDNVRMRWTIDNLLAARDVLNASKRNNKGDRLRLAIVLAELKRRGVPGSVRRY